MYAARTFKKVPRSYFDTFLPDIQPFIALLELTGPRSFIKDDKRVTDTVYRLIQRSIIKFYIDGDNNAHKTTEQSLLTEHENMLKIPKKIESTQPFILIKLRKNENNEEKIIQCYLVIDFKMHPIPSNVSFPELFDIYFKLHYILNIEFASSMQNFTNNIANHVYQLQKVKTFAAESRLQEYIAGYDPTNLQG